ncbi:MULTISPECIES: PTS glucose transporter subunit IIA [unclassified Streptomyces]|uniref:PTS sugar transporter subunit IIA n=1 Tax=unclassified Streptomyces TaxID=2593676 RepID=UPI00089B351C|nr:MULTISPECIES: PTS glucose transporter subunit IIA [unclassified Streptomyces]WSX89878.1 PTS glucose transporter subunit IIA [Streptomyces sp. NBC_00891]WSY04358.1 PTS glucose transporter subunit IIA [Streptomyces sp. NBC_00890]WSZ05983.1 PTS glucose transporter subunit IIA [Streptomyces sp. NBC_00869]WSZ26521.1 PTS glucose transporter subunit IIA [Streptomyces sp. NBC_00870]NED16323.1 PTS glucose transporter subunit IIA [Streptomyces sp. SID9124]
MTTVTSPLAGRAIGLAAVPDPVFAGAMVGPGTAIDPVREASEAIAPVDGIVVSLHPHAFVVVDSEGHGVLTHLGIDTVQLNGEGFELLVSKGDTVTRGQGIVRWDPSAVEKAGKSPVCPIVALEATADSLSDLVESGDVAVGDTLFGWQ